LPLVPDDMRQGPELEGGSRLMLMDDRFGGAAWEKTFAFEGVLRTRTAALESQGRDIPDQKVAVTYLSAIFPAPSP
jgi:hypothetical protein